MKTKIDFRKALLSIAAGLTEKEMRGERGKFVYSESYKRGISMISVLALEYSGKAEEELRKMNEESFLREYASKPVKEWFSDWDEKAECFVDAADMEYLETGALAELNGDNDYYVTDECHDLANAAEWDLTGAVEQRKLYERMSRELTQEQYVQTRKFIIENRICEAEKLAEFRRDVTFIINDAYEEAPIGSVVCQNCGWTAHKEGLEYRCCCRECKDSVQDSSKTVKGNMLRLKRGIMLFTSKPGDGELELYEYAKKRGINVELWYDMDSYDLRINLPNGFYYAIDVKDVKNASFLSASIKDDITLKNIAMDKKCKGVYYVVPDKHIKRNPDYIRICNKGINGSENIKCVGMSDMKKLIKEAGLNV